MKLKDVFSLEEGYDKPRLYFKKLRHHFADKHTLVKAMVFPVVVYRCACWTIKKAEHQRIDAFKLWCWRGLESPLDSKEIKPINSKGNQPRIFIGRTDAEASILCPPDAKSRLIGKDLMPGKVEGKRRRG